MSYKPLANFFLLEALLMTTVRIRTKNGLGFRGFESRELCPSSGHTARLSPKERLQSAPRAKELRSATAFRVQLAF